MKQCAWEVTVKCPIPETFQKRYDWECNPLERECEWGQYKELTPEQPDKEMDFKTRFTTHDSRAVNPKTRYLSSVSFRLKISQIWRKIHLTDIRCRLKGG